MTKTIEDAAKDYAYDRGDSDWERMRLQDAFMDGTNYIMQLPLSLRLTAEEKERVRKMYKRMVVDVENSDSYDCIPASDMDNVMETLESIFGSDFFKEEE